MNTRLAKETRDLLPMFAGTLPLIIVPQLIWPQMGFGFAALGVACVVMAGSVFGNEFQHRTLSLLLSQPIARSVLWRDKMLVLGGGMLMSLAALLLCLAVSRPAVGHDNWLVLVSIPLCAFCGAPYWTLSLRHSIAGMVSAVGAPCVILAAYALVVDWLGMGKTDQVATGGLLLLLIYCAVVYKLGYAKFKQLEDADGRSRELSLPAGFENFLVRPLTKASARFRGPFATLLKKEFRLQQISFLLAGLFVLIAVAGFCLIKFRPELAGGIVGGDCFLYVLILPLIAGAISIGEERGWGMAEWHLTLPPSALKQWSAKMLAALSTSLVLGLLLPAALFLAGLALLGKLGAGPAGPPDSTVLIWVLTQLLVTSVAVYAASFSKTTLRAILAALAILLVGIVVLWLTPTCVHKIGPPSFQWSGRAAVAAGRILPLLPWALGFMVCLIQWFAWSNFRRCGLPVLRLIAQLSVILLTFGLLAWGYCTALYYRGGL